MKRSLRLAPLFYSLSLVGCIHFAPKPEIAVVDAAFTDVTLFETGLEFTLRLTNDTPEPMQIDGASYHFYLNGEDIGSGSSGDEINLPRYGSATQKVRVGLSNLTMLTRVHSLVESKHVDYKVESNFHFKGAGPFRATREVTKTGELDLSEFGDGSGGGFDSE